MAVRIRNLQVDVPPDAFDTAVAFWAGALGGVPRPVEGGRYVHLDGVRSRVGVHLQRLDDGAAGYHLDLESDALETDLDRLLAAGADDRGPIDDEPGARVLADPAGLPFCITTTGQSQHLDDGRDLVHVRVVMLDVPHPVAAAQADFWAAALDGEATPVGEQYPEYTWVQGAVGPGGPTNVAVQALGDGVARLHLDLHCADEPTRDSEVLRLIELGATERARTRHWVVLEAPGGHLFCVVPDRPA